MFQKIFGVLLVLLAAVNYVGAQNLQTQTSTLFSGSGNCTAYHPPGSVNSNALS